MQITRKRKEVSFGELVPKLPLLVCLITVNCLRRPARLVLYQSQCRPGS